MFEYIYESFYFPFVLHVYCGIKSAVTVEMKTLTWIKCFHHFETEKKSEKLLEIEQ